MSQPTIQRPQLLLIEDNPMDAQLAQIMLKAAGFEVIHAATLLEAETCALRLLAPDASLALLLLFDIQMPDASHEGLASPLLVAALCGRMQRGELKPAHMVALTSHVTGAIEEEALFAGCSHVLGKPLTNQHCAWLRTLAEQPVTLPSAEQGRRLYQQKAEEILQLVRRASTPNLWTEEDAHLVLSAATQYPAPKPLDQSRQAALVLKLGGIARIREHLKACADLFVEPHKSILAAYLAGKQQRDLAVMFPDYDRTTVYRQSQSLPRRVCEYFASIL